MKSFSATYARSRFGQLIVAAQVEPVRVQRHGRDVAVVMSAEEFRRLAGVALDGINPAIDQLHAESAERWAGVYKALAR